MPQTANIVIDLDVHRAIENRRTSFDQSPNAILRDILGLASGQPEFAHKARRPRRIGKYAVTLLGDRFVAESLKEAYTRCLRTLGELDSQFFERLSQLTTRSRRIVARKPTDLYLRKPELAEKFAVRLTGPWWVDINLSKPQCEQRLRISCEVAGIRFGGDDGDLILDFPDGKTPAPGLKDLLVAAPLEGIEYERPRDLGREVDL